MSEMSKRYAFLSFSLQQAYCYEKIKKTPYRLSYMEEWSQQQFQEYVAAVKRFMTAEYAQDCPGREYVFGAARAMESVLPLVCALQVRQEKEGRCFPGAPPDVQETR